MLKAQKYFAQDHATAPASLGLLSWFHNYGMLLSFIIIGWACFCAFHSTAFSSRNFGEEAIVWSGLVLSGCFFILAIVLTLAGITALFSPIP